MLEHDEPFSRIMPADRKKFELEEREQLASQIGELRQQAEAAAASGDPTALRDFDIQIAARLQVADKFRALERSRRLRDPLTNLHNRVYFDILKDEITNSPEVFQNIIGFLFLDIDHFKLANDTVGHIEGDKILTGVAQTIRSSVDHRDEVCRYGGEEFVAVIVGSLTEESSRRTILKEVAERIRMRVESMEMKNLPKVTVSIGGAEFTGSDREQVDRAIKKADKLLYEAKNDGRNRVKISEEI